MSAPQPRIGVSLAGVSYVILNFEFTNKEMIPAGIRLVERNPEEEARRRLAALPTTGRGRQWMENVQMVTPENIHVTLTTEGFTPDKLQYTPRAPDQGRGGMVKYMVMVRYSRLGMEHLPEDAPAYELKFGTEKGSGEAIIRLLSSTWGYTHSFDNRPAGKDNVSFHFVHRKEIRDRKVALVAHDGFLTHVSLETAEKEMELVFCSPDAFPLPVSEKKPGEQHVAPRGRRPHHHDNRGQGNGGDNRRHHHGGGQHKAQRHEQRRRDDRHPHREPAQRSAPTAMTPPPVVAIDDGFGGMKNALDLAMK